MSNDYRIGILITANCELDDEDDFLKPYIKGAFNSSNIKNFMT